MKKSLSLVVALAMVFSLLVPAMAFAATAQEEAAGNTLKELGVLKGNEQGDLMLDKELTRQEMIILLSRLLGVEDEAKNHANTHGWPDVANSDFDGYISWAKENGLTKGVEDGSVFGYDQALTVEQLLQFLLRALGYTDVAWDDVASTAVELGLIAAGTDVKAVAKRGTMAVVTLTTLDTNVNGENVTLGAKLGLPGYEVGAVAIASFKAVGAKKLEVAFNKAVDASKANFSVKRGTNTVSYAKVTWEDNNSTAVIELNSKLFQGSYDVSVTGLTEQALTASVTVDNEKVSAIEFTTGDIVPLPRVTPPDVPKTADVSYVVKNQYGEEMAANVRAFSTFGGERTPANNKVTVDKGSELKVNDTFTVTIYHQETGIQVQKNFTIGEKAVASNIEVIGLYHKDNKQLKVNSNLAEFKLIVEIKDQYGNVMLNVNEVKTDVDATIIAGLNLKLKDPVKEKINDVERIVYGIEKTDTTKDVIAGKAIANFFTKIAIPAQLVQYTFDVADAVKVDQIILNGVSDLIAEGETVKIPVVALDQNNNPVTDIDHLNDAKNDASNPLTVNPAGAEFKKDGDNVYLEFTAGAQGPLFVYVVSETGKTSSLQITVNPKAKPVVITGLNANQTKLVFYDMTLSLDAGSFVIEDQYGRQMSKSAIEALLGAGADKYTVRVSGDGDAVVADDKELNAANSPIKLSGAKKGEKSLTFQIYNNGNPVNGSDFTTTFRTVVISEITSIEVADLGTFYNTDDNSWGSTYARDLKVTGLTSDGQKVTLPAETYTVHVADGVKKAVKGDGTGYTLRAETVDIAEDKDTAEFTVEVVVNALGLNAEAKGVASKVAPKVGSVVFKDNDDKTITETKVANNANVTWDDFKLEIKDQYGVKATGTAPNYVYGDNQPVDAPKVLFSNIELNDVNGQLPEITNNGGVGASLQANSNLKSFTVTLDFGGVKASIKVIVE